MHASLDLMHGVVYGCEGATDGMVRASPGCADCKGQASGLVSFLFLTPVTGVNMQVMLIFRNPERTGVQTTHSNQQGNTKVCTNATLFVSCLGASWRRQRRPLHKCSGS